MQYQTPQQQAQYQSQQQAYQNQQQRQMAQLRMMQQQAASPHRPPAQVAAGFPPPIPMQQFYAARGQFPHQPNISPMHMQGRPLVPMPPQQQNMSTLPGGPHPAGGQGQQQQGNQQGGPNDSQNDPLFMLK